MSELILVIGNKNYSSWSLRPWIALKAAGIPFREVKVLLDLPDSKEKIAAWSPSGRVPVLADGDLRVWDSLAICEYAAERFPDAGLWPSRPADRAIARSISAEMHSGFMALRTHCPMNLHARTPKNLSAEVQADVDRICAIWRERLAGGGPFLLGRFSIADAMYAPVASRFRTYAVPLDDTCAAYRDRLLAHPAFLEWERDALTEPEMARYR